MRGAWTELGLRARLAISIGGLFLVAFGIVFIAVRAEMADESPESDREEAREHGVPAASDGRQPSISSISDAQSEVERTFLLVGGLTLVAALTGGYLIAARTASPLRRMAATADEVQAGDLTPRLREEPAAAPELRALIADFNRMLERLDLAFSNQRRFVSDASHELRTPLTAVRGQIEVLARNPNPSADEVERVEAVTLHEIDRMEQLVEELLALARLDELSKIKIGEVDLGNLLQGLAESDPSRAEPKGIAAGHVRGDSELLTRAVRNLLANARRHAGDSGRVLLGATAAGDRVTVAVEDDGPGIPAAVRDRVFERFHRVDESRVRDSGGSGLGLAICREIVAAHGGRIWVEDSPLGGARVAFELPGFAPEP
jgi:signal transduction histidine kinase